MFTCRYSAAESALQLVVHDTAECQRHCVALRACSCAPLRQALAHAPGKQGGASPLRRAARRGAGAGRAPAAAGWPLMSVAAHHSPCIGAKRFFESAEAPEYGHGKRLRQPQQLGVSPLAGRARTGREGRAYVVTAAALAALRGLFPDMDEKVSNPAAGACFCLTHLGHLSGTWPGRSGQRVTSQSCCRWWQTCWMRAATT